MTTFQHSDQLTISNPAGMYDPSGFGYSHVAEVAAGARLAFIAGQGGEREDGTFPESFEEQVDQAFHNLLTALASVGAGPKDVAKLTVYIVDHAEEKLGVYGAALMAAWGDVATPTATLVPVPRLALDAMLFEIEAVAVIPG
ncbi:RidA family protein [Georgenia sunbinii]|uniref:RidA family protein n=1 Tax=Georgenia sunbinii TaxID=3117728 RepID=UPI002F2612EA